MFTFVVKKVQQKFVMLFCCEKNATKICHIFFHTSHAHICCEQKVGQNFVISFSTRHICRGDEATKNLSYLFPHVTFVVETKQQKICHIFFHTSHAHICRGD